MHIAERLAVDDIDGVVCRVGDIEASSSRVHRRMVEASILGVWW
jgi:hypothetical protein